VIITTLKGCGRRTRRTVAHAAKEESVPRNSARQGGSGLWDEPLFTATLKGLPQYNKDQEDKVLLQGVDTVTDCLAIATGEAA
jgi:hypothetical protein